MDISSSFFLFLIFFAFLAAVLYSYQIAGRESMSGTFLFCSSFLTVESGIYSLSSIANSKQPGLAMCPCPSAFLGSRLGGAGWRLLLPLPLLSSLHPKTATTYPTQTPTEKPASLGCSGACAALNRADGVNAAKRIASVGGRICLLVLRFHLTHDPNYHHQNNTHMRSMLQPRRQRFAAHNQSQNKQIRRTHPSK
jgi:hypothetical protein